MHVAVTVVLKCRQACGVVVVAVLRADSFLCYATVCLFFLAVPIQQTSEAPREGDFS